MVEPEHENRGLRLLRRTRAGLSTEQDPVTHVEQLSGRAAAVAEWPEWVPERVLDELRASGITQPWAHQVRAAETAHAGRNLIIATGTASGKSLAYQLPVLGELAVHERACALYLAPTKALGADQLRTVTGFDLHGIRPASYDGDTPSAQRDWVRTHARWVFTNPDMLHRGILSGHAKWARFFRRLSYVVVDECHSYRGLFGSHVALLLRRLRRIARYYGSDPVFVLASATMADPGEFGLRLCGRPCTAITVDSSPRAPRTIALWQPPLLQEHSGEQAAPVRRSAGSEAARILTELVIEGVRSLAFVRSRQGAELTAIGARRMLSEATPELTDKVAAYRGGLLPEERRRLETALAEGDLLGVATTSALELGVDITGLDAVVLAGYPGTLASFWQQAGRAGRATEEALVVFIAREDPLDTYLVRHPAAVLERPIEATVVDPTNRHVLGPELTCAAAELPLTAGELDDFGGDAALETLGALVSDKSLRRRSSGWYWTARSRPHNEVDIRGSAGEQIAVVESETARLLGTVDPSSACGTIHPGAVHIHQGVSYVVDDLDLDAGLALVHEDDPDWSTSPREVTDIAVLRTLQETVHGGVRVVLGDVAASSQVVGYLRKRPSGEIIDQTDLDLPAQVLHTRAVWYTISSELLDTRNSGLEPTRLPGALHAAEHAAIGLLPLFATCDRWDIGGVSTTLHPDTGAATVFVHDGYPGGAGFADRGHTTIREWLVATREVINACSCPSGCPSCVYSPKCGNGNEPLDKTAAVTILDIVLGAIQAQGSSTAGERQ